VIARRRSPPVRPATAAGNAIQYRDTSNDSFQTGGFGLTQAKSFDAVLRRLLDRFLGRHDIKGGIEAERRHGQRHEVSCPAASRFDVFANTVHPSQPIYRHFYWTTPDATVANAPVSALVATPRHHVTSVYLQDRWTLEEPDDQRWHSWDRQQIIDASGTTQIDMKKDYAPRLGFVWSPAGLHRDRVYGSYGRFLRRGPDGSRDPLLLLRAPAAASSTTVRPAPLPMPRPEADFGTPSAILGGFHRAVRSEHQEPVPDRVHHRYDHELRPNVAVGVKGIYRQLRPVIEDFLCATTARTASATRQGIMKQIFTLDYSHTVTARSRSGRSRASSSTAPSATPTTGRPLVSYLYSKLDGNYDGEYAPFTNVGPDPNISAAYDYYDFSPTAAI